MFLAKWLWKNLKGSRVKYIFSLILAAVLPASIIITPAYTAYVVDNAIVGKINESGETVRNLELLLPYLLFVIVYALFLQVVFYAMFMLTEKSSQHILVNIRAHLYRNMHQQDNSFWNNIKIGEVMTRFTGDLEAIRHATAWIVRSAIDSLVLFLVSVIYLFTIDWILTLIMVAISPLMIVITRAIKKNVRPRFAEARAKLETLSGRVNENIAGVRTVKSFARKEHEMDVFDRNNAEFKETTTNAVRAWLRYFPALEGIAHSFTVIVLVIGGIFVINGRITIGEYSAFTTLSWAIANPVRIAGRILNDLQRFITSAQKVIELYYAHPIIKDLHDSIELNEKLSGYVEYKNVTLRFDHKTILDNVSFTVKQGETVVIMGSTGSGKTTLINMLLRFYDADEGEICIDGINIKKIKMKDLRKNIGVATQEVFLFSDTVDSNIAYSNSSMPEENARRYAELAEADFAMKLTEGMATVVGERGTGLSGGQKQRLSLARAFAAQPAILILDDTTSALDLETEQRVRQNLDKLDFCCTKIIVAQRVSTAQTADRIIILENGKIAETGTHHELIHNQGYYYEIYKLQNNL